MSQQNTHENHRRRMRDKIRDKGLDGLPDHEILEFLLFFAIPRRDVNALAHNLINRFSSLSGVLDAGHYQLMAEEGIGESASTFLSALPAVFRAYQLERVGMGHVFDTLDDANAYLNQHFFGRSVETLIMMCLSSTNQMLSIHTVEEGCVESVPLPIRRIMSHALAVPDTKRVIIGHNHPRGFLYPSDADIRCSLELQKAFSYVGIILSDHIIGGDDDYVSLRNSNLLASV